MLNAIAGSLLRIANDLRLMASGPRGHRRNHAARDSAGLEHHAGQSEPCDSRSGDDGGGARDGNQTTVTFCTSGSFFELNVMLPMIAYSLTQSIALLSSAARVLAEKAVDGITANEERARHLLEGNLSLATALAPRIGYDLAAQIAKDAFKEGKTAREVARVKANLPEAELDDILNARRMTEPGIPGGVIMPGGG